jgi:hypothetical protein
MAQMSIWKMAMAGLHCRLRRRWVLNGYSPELAKLTDRYVVHLRIVFFTSAKHRGAEK